VQFVTNEAEENSEMKEYSEEWDLVRTQKVNTALLSIFECLMDYMEKQKGQLSHTK
jgi:hypothetical protein